MISELKIENLILIEKSKVRFGPHLNILTGETGSGKSVILAAIRLIAGERADFDAIGKWKEQMIVEAKLDDHLIRREIHRSGKSQCYVDGNLVTLSFLKQFIGVQIEIIDQNSSQTLASAEFQKHKLDLFASLTLEASKFAVSFQEELHLKNQLAELNRRKQDYERDLAWAETSLALIQEVNWKSGEEEALNEEHEKLSHTQELAASLNQIATQLLESASLKQLAHQLQSTVRFDSKLQPIAETVKSCALELDEAEKEIRSYLDRLEDDPSRLAHLETRIAAIESIKKRFGATHSEVESKKLFFQNLIDSQSEIEGEINATVAKISDLEEKNRLLGQVLSDKRKAAAPRFAKAIEAQLRELNLPHAQFQVHLETKPLSISGNENIRFLFSANQGHIPAPLEDCASGGEQSRLLFSIQAILAEKMETGCLVFDEIDSNIGGYTASIVGEKLKQLAMHRQVICVTHFAQVASFAMDHFSVRKESGTIEISHLTEEQREKEYIRMQGILK